MKKELVVHIGLPKTATTYIQKLMARQENYFGLEGENSGFSVTLLKIFSRFSKGKNVVGDIEAWCKELTLYIDNKRITTPVILSNEFFLAGELNQVNEFPLIHDRHPENKPLVIDFIKLLSEVVENRFIVRTLFTIRNQLEWLASKYAQASKKIVNASQEDFQRRLDYYSQNCGLYWFNWFLWVDKLDSTLGKENVTVLCMEDMEDDSFWNELSLLFTGDERKLVGGSQVGVNRKRSADSTWKLDSFRLGSYISKKIGLTPGTYIHKLVTKWGNRVSNVYLYPIKNKARTLNLTNEYFKNYNIIFQEGNRLLEARLNQDWSASLYLNKSIRQGK